MPQPFSYHPNRSVPGVSFEPTDLVSPMSVASGGFATLWRAGSRGQYAIKCFNNGGMAAAEEEFEALLLLSGCSSVPQVYSLGTFVNGMEQGSAAIVEEYIEGYTLAGVLKRGLVTGSVRLPVFETQLVVKVATELARALAKLEQVGVSHRDLSANNVMLSKDCVARHLSGGIELALIDFGQSTPTSRPSVTPSFRARLATVPYGAPEMYGGEHWERRNSCKCDVWSFGSIIVTMMCGEYWPDEISDLTVGISSARDLERITDAKRRPLDLVKLLGETGRRVGDLEKRLAYVVQRCTQFDPDMRPKASELLNTMEHIAPGNTPRTPRRRPQERMPQQTSRVHVSREAPLAPPLKHEPMNSSVPGQAGRPESGNAFNGDLKVRGTTLVRYTGQEREVAIPEGIVGIGARAFAGCTFLERVLMPESVGVVGEYAFEGCTSLRGIVLASVSQLGVGAFSGCTSLTSVTVRKPVSNIAWYLFRDCTSLESVRLPHGIRSIGTEAFCGCAALTQINIPDTVTQIGDRAFYGCTSLGRLSVPTSVTMVGEDAFVTGFHRSVVEPAYAGETPKTTRRVWMAAAGAIAVALAIGLAAVVGSGVLPWHQNKWQTKDEVNAAASVPQKTIVDDEICTIGAYSRFIYDGKETHYPISVVNKSSKKIHVEATASQGNDPSGNLSMDVDAKGEATDTLWFEDTKSEKHVAQIKVTQDGREVSSAAFDSSVLGV